jgi:pilus assembly protein CpaB
MKSMVLLALAVGCGLVAMLGVKQVMSKKKGAAEADLVTVLVATTDIPPGIPLNESNVAFKKVPRDLVPPGAVTKPEEYADRSLRVAAVANETIFSAKLNEPGMFGASCEIEPGMRVVSVAVDATKTHSGLMQPGDRVDVLVTYKVRNDSGMINKTKTVLEYIKVFATDNRRATVVQSDEEGDYQAKNISLLVDPEQANLLMLAESKGKIHLALRNEKDTATADAAAVDDEFFEDTAASMGAEDKTEPHDPFADAAQDIHAAIQQEQEVQEKGPSWQVQIFAGADQVLEEIDLETGTVQRTEIRQGRGGERRPDPRDDWQPPDLKLDLPENGVKADLPKVSA